MKIIISRSVNYFLEKAKTVWKIEEWGGENDSDKDVLFFGLYLQEDYEAFDKINGNRNIFWCGSDILMLINNQERQDIIKKYPETKHYCENETEAINLGKVGIKPEVIPSFLGNIYNYSISFCPPLLEGEKWKMWLCGHPGREEEYGFNEAKELTKIFNNLEIHIYGVDGENTENVFYHGLIPEEQLDKEIRKYHCGFRANTHDGNSEVVMKSLLLGQYPITRLPYEDVWQYNSFLELVILVIKLQQQSQPNYRPRVKWIKKINQFPWCYHNYWKPDEDEK